MPDPAVEEAINTVVTPSAALPDASASAAADAAVALASASMPPCLRVQRAAAASYATTHSICLCGRNSALCRYTRDSCAPATSEDVRSAARSPAAIA